MAASVEGVFINVPFDRQYQTLFRALVFTIHECGFISRCSLEAEDGSVLRLEKLYTIISECPLGIHDLSRALTTAQLPRYNMPLELGLFLGAKRYGSGAQRRKSCVILDRDRYRYQQYCSDIAGQDVRAHANRTGNAINAVRDWLRTARPARAMKGGAMIEERFKLFWTELPGLCRDRGLNRGALPFADYRLIVTGWLGANPGTGAA